MKSIKMLVLGIIIGFLLFFLVNLLNENLTIKKTSKMLVEFYELMFPNVKFSVENVKKENGMFKFLLKGSDGNYREVFVSLGGNYLSGAVISLKESVMQIQKLKNFVDCLYSKGVRIFGMLQSNNTAINQATSLQLNLLGMYSSKLYVSCDGEALQSCLSIGLRALPAIVYENKSYEGVVFSIDNFSNITGCKLG